MRLTVDEQIRRKQIEYLVEYDEQEHGKIELDREEMRARILEKFSKQLDAKLKNLQESEGLAVTFSIDIVSTNGKVRGGSGAERNMPEYIEWRRSVYQRDNYTCQKCGNKSDLNAHHIKPWSGYPELRFDVNNGLTLCKDCHSLEHPHIGWMR